MWFIGVEVEQETSAPPPKKNPGSAPGTILFNPRYQDLYLESTVLKTNFGEIVKK